MYGIATPCVPVSWGELLDKVTILEIKRERIAQPAARANVLREYDALFRLCDVVLLRSDVAEHVSDLKRVNERLWEIEDAIREEEAKGEFGASFVRLARSVYQENDKRAVIKRRINAVLGSELVEEKSYWSAEGAGHSFNVTR